MRIGYGIRHPAFAAVLARSAPDLSYHDDSWANGTLAVELSAHLGEVDLPDELVTSIRCVVEARGRIVVCQAPDGLHALPGGRRETGETMAQTAVREVREETGWHVDAETLTPLGFIHLRLRDDPPPGYAYPHPDSAQVVFGGRASTRATGPDDDWVDSDGWEVGSFLAEKSHVLDLALSPVSVPFVRAVLATG